MKKQLRKLLPKIGTPIALLAPVVTVISCGIEPYKIPDKKHTASFKIEDLVARIKVDPSDPKNKVSGTGKILLDDETNGSITSLTGVVITMEHPKYNGHLANDTDNSHYHDANSQDPNSHDYSQIKFNVEAADGWQLGSDTANEFTFTFGGTFTTSYNDKGFLFSFLDQTQVYTNGDIKLTENDYIKALKIVNGHLTIDNNIVTGVFISFASLPQRTAQLKKDDTVTFNVVPLASFRMLDQSGQQILSTTFTITLGQGIASSLTFP